MSESEAASKQAELTELRKKLNAASWSPELEELMKSWGEKAAGLRWMHQSAAGTWKGMADRLSLWGIGVTSLASTASLVTAGIDGGEYLMYGVGALGGIAAMIQTLKKFYNAEEKSADHAIIAKKFGSFYRAMTIELGMSPVDRRPSDVVLDWAAKEYDQLQLDAPPLSGKVVKDYKNTFTTMENLPDIAEDDFIIKVNS